MVRLSVKANVLPSLAQPTLKLPKPKGVPQLREDRVRRGAEDAEAGAFLLSVVGPANEDIVLRAEGVIDPGDFAVLVEKIAIVQRYAHALGDVRRGGSGGAVQPVQHLEKC